MHETWLHCECEVKLVVGELKVGFLSSLNFNQRVGISVIEEHFCPTLQLKVDFVFVVEDGAVGTAQANTPAKLALLVEKEGCD